MLSSTLVLALSLAPAAFAAPTQLVKRALSANDTAVLKLANTLEYLEYTLYSGGHDKFSDADFTSAGFPAGFRDQVGVIADHEKTHAAALAAILTSNGETAPRPCQFKFPYTDPRSFVALANAVTSVGIGAYLGGSTLLTDNVDLLTKAGSILTVEARHDAYLRTGAGASPFPTAYDTALTAVWVYSLASEFIVSCPDPLNIVTLPKLTFSPDPMPPQLPPPPAPATLTFNWDPSKFFVPVAPDAKLYIAYINQISDPVFVPVTKTGAGSGTVPVASGVGGVVFAVLTTFSGGLSAMQLSQFGTLAGPAEIVVG